MSLRRSEFNEQLVEKILQQGQQLRNSMIESILKNDPLGRGNLNSKHYNTPQSSTSTLLSNKYQDLPVKLVRGCLTSREEDTAINKCLCITCEAYDVNCLKCDLRRTNINTTTAHTELKQKCSSVSRVLKNVDTLKIVLHTIYLNEYGIKKISQGLPKIPQSVYDTYLIEYNLPKVLRKDDTKQDSDTKQVRINSRRTNDVVALKRSFLHNVCNLDSDVVENECVKFVLKYKARQNKAFQLFGVSKFPLACLVYSKSLSCTKTLRIYLNETSPIVIGTLKATFQFGCGKIFFGKEFVDAVSNQDRSDVNIVNANKIIKDLKQKNINVACTEPKNETSRNKIEIVSKQSSQVVKSPRQSAYFSKPDVKQPTIYIERAQNELQTSTKNILLSGFIYVSEAQFLNIKPNSYVLCQPFCQNDKLISKIVCNTGNPLYNFCQTVPLLYDDNFLLNLKDNFMIIEFWEKTDQTERPFGFTHVPLHQFYLAYRNPVVLNHLKQNKLPIVGNDWWEPIHSTENNETLIGQVQVLTALGTQEQILNLELERGFRNDVVKAKFPSSLEIKSKTNKTGNFPFIKIKKMIDRNPKRHVNMVDVAIQSDLTMDNKDDKVNFPRSQEMLSSFLKLLEDRPRTVCVENSTNTETVNPPVSRMEESPIVMATTPKLRKTSDLLDSLQKMLGPNMNQARAKPASFKAQIMVNSANQLPYRRKIKSKSKRTKGKHPKQEDNLMPTTYVTFETMPGEQLQTTNVFAKSTSPQWNYQCNVDLPLDLLTNGQKRLIFKVWKKSTSAVLQPNVQTDLVLGFAALDISVLSAGLPNVQGWFNIMDFSGKCNGQINIHVHPLEQVHNITNVHGTRPQASFNSAIKAPLPPCPNENGSECNELLSRTLKRKFTELDEITQRLRLRLSEVVQEDSGESNDEMSEQFENDINNLCVEDDFDLINFEDEARKFSENHSGQKNAKGSNENLLCVSSASASEKQASCNDDLLADSSRSLLELTLDKNNFGRERINNLLEKLSLATGETVRDVPDVKMQGCGSISEILEPSQDSCLTTQSGWTTEKSKNEGSETSIITDFSDCRPSNGQTIVELNGNAV